MSMCTFAPLNTVLFNRRFFFELNITLYILIVIIILYTPAYLQTFQF
jgi:hypothetical protein